MYYSWPPHSPTWRLRLKYFPFILEFRGKTSLGVLTETQKPLPVHHLETHSFTNKVAKHQRKVCRGSSHLQSSAKDNWKSKNIK